jgi:tetratricopeptide (TPR) repeat protein
MAIADSLRKPIRFAKLAREKMEADIAPSELTELASALGSLEAENGNHRVARRFLRQALIDANENSVAQIRWLNRSHLGEAIDVSHANPPLLHEANSWASYYKGEFETAQKEALSWLEDQPFASAPATLSSFIAADIFLDFESGKSIALASLKSNPDDPMLLNNLAVCLMELGELDTAATTLSRLKYEDRGGKIDATHKATFGMFAFRKGNYEEGRKLYLDAIVKATNSGEKATAARAASHLVIEELIADTTNVEEAILRLKEFDGLDEFKERSRFFDRIRALMKAEQRGLLPLVEASSIIGRGAV